MAPATKTMITMHMPAITRRFPLFALLLLTALLARPVQAQERTREGVLLTWNGSLEVAQAQLENGRHRLQGQAFTVYESDARTVATLWRAACQRKGLVVSGKSPLRAAGAGLPGGAGLLLMRTEKGAAKGEVRVVLVHALTDSTALADEAEARAAARSWAVELNRAVVQKQIDAHQVLVTRASSNVEKATRATDKAAQRSAKAAKDLDKAKASKAKLDRKQTDLERERQRLQERYDKNKDPKTLAKLTKVQSKLLSVQQDLLKQSDKEASARAAADKRADAVPGQQRKLDKEFTEMNELNTQLDALRRKLEAVQ